MLWVFGPTRPERTSLLSRVFEQAQHATYYPVPQQHKLLYTKLFCVPAININKILWCFDRLLTKMRICNPYKKSFVILTFKNE